MSKAEIMRILDYTPKGAGLDQWPPLDPKDVASGNPVQRGRYYFEGADIGLYCGVWDCTAFEGTMGAYSVDEFMILLEGSVTIREENGRETTIKAGESFLIPRGLRCAWKQPGYLRKIFVIYEDPDRPVPAKPALDHCTKIDVTAPMSPSAGPDPSLVVGDYPQWSDRQIYADVGGRFLVGLWGTTLYERKVVDFPRHELMHFTKGSLSLGDGAGASLGFDAGSTVFVPRGARLGWSSKEDVAKIYCMLMPK